MTFNRYIGLLVVGALIALFVFENSLLCGLGVGLAAHEIVSKIWDTIIHPSSHEEAAQ